MPEGITNNNRALTGEEVAYDKLVKEAKANPLDIKGMEEPYTTHLSYPQKGLGETGLKSYIVFRIVKEKVLNPGAAIKTTVDVIKDLISSLEDTTEGESERAGTEVAEAIATIGAGAVGAATGVTLEELKRLATNLPSFQGDNDGENTSEDFLEYQEYVEPDTYEETIRLYMPQFVFNDGVSYDNAELGVLGAAAVGGSKGDMGNVLGAGKDLLKSSVSDVLRGGKNSSVAASLALQRLKSVPIFGDLFVKNLAATQIATGVKQSPNVRVLFNSTNLRSFSFSFNLIASSTSEAREINEIVKRFRTELYPEALIQKIGDANVEVGLKFPNRFLLSLHYGEKEIFHKIKPCYLTSMSTTYNKSQSGMHYDGQPFEVDITLNFSESLALNRGDIEAGY